MGISRDQAISFIKNGCTDILTHSEWSADPVVQVEAIKQNPSLIMHIQNPSVHLQKIAVSIDWTVIKYIDKPHVDIQIIAMENALTDDNKDVLKYVDKQNKYVQKFMEDNNL